MDHIADEQRANEGACYETAQQNGFTIDDADVCDAGDVGCPDCPFMEERQAKPPTTTEIVYTWPDGREEVRYRRPYASDDARRFVREVKELHRRERDGDVSPYSIRHI